MSPGSTAREGGTLLARRAVPLGIALVLAAQALIGVATAPAASAAPIGTDWPMFHHDAQHLGVSADTQLGASNVAGLGLKWQANIGFSYVSPAVVYNATLGETLVYVGNNAGLFAAYDAQTGNRVWFYKTQAAIQSSPAVDGNVVYFGDSDHYLYALNATTGTLDCRFNSGGVIYSSPTIMDPNGTGKIVYFGDSGQNAGDDGGHFWAINAVDPNAAADCSLDWSYNAFGNPPGSATLTGVWSPPAFARDVNGRAMIVFGGSSPEGAVYALDAVTGLRIWRFQTQTFAQDQDVGAGPTISPPGVNGFVDGVVYVAGKDAIMYALNLRTGAEIWEYPIRNGRHGATRNSAALVGRTLYVGNGVGPGVYAIDAITGVKVWSSADTGTAEVLSSPAVTGASGNQILFVGDSLGKVYAHSLSTGQVLWSYNTGQLIYSSPAVVGGMMFIANTGFLFAFGIGGGTSAPPDTTITSPVKGSTVANPNGNQALGGTATDDVGVPQVLIEVQDKDRGLWWNGATQTWSAVANQNPATLSSPGGTSTNWSYAFPAPTNGGPFNIQAEAVDTDGQHDPTIATSNFTIASLLGPPDTTITAPRLNQLFTFPGGVRQSFTINVSGTATDTAGANPGVATVYIVVENIEHVEYYCGAPGCGGGETGYYKPTWFKLTATLANPGATSTAWSFSFPTYDHPHTYRITAWAVDKDGNPDPTRATVNRICVEDPGQGTCP